MKTVTIDNEEWVRKEDSHAQQTLDGMTYCVVRTYSAGVHIGYVKELKNTKCILIKSKRLWGWSGANELNQVAMDGVDVENSKISTEVPEVTLTQAIEIIPCSEKSMICFQEAKEWIK